MLIHIEKDNPKPLEQKIQDLILRKLFIKVDDDLILLKKDDAISLLLLDIISVACCDYDLSKAVSFRKKIQEQYNKPDVLIKQDLQDVVNEFEVEIDAYRFYFNASDGDFTEDDICMEVLLILNSEFELLENKLHQLIVDSVSLKISEADTKAMNLDRMPLLENYANYVKIISTHDSISDAAEELHVKNRSINKRLIQDELEKFAPALQDEIIAYKMALSMNEQNAEFSSILATVKKLLKLES